jgi:hypothetical protein
LNRSTEYFLAFAQTVVIVTLASAFMFVLARAAEKHHHPAILPTDQATWNSCCDERDCIEAKVRIRYLNKSTAFVSVDEFEPFTVASDKVLPSANGHSYHCRYDISKPPSTDNIRCVFIAAGNYAKR